MITTCKKCGKSDEISQVDMTAHWPVILTRSGETWSNGICEKCLVTQNKKPKKETTEVLNGLS